MDVVTDDGRWWLETWEDLRRRRQAAKKIKHRIFFSLSPFTLITLSVSYATRAPATSLPHAPLRTRSSNWHVFPNNAAARAALRRATATPHHAPRTLLPRCAASIISLTRCSLHFVYLLCDGQRTTAGYLSLLAEKLMLPHMHMLSLHCIITSALLQTNKRKLPPALHSLAWYLPAISGGVTIGALSWRAGNVTRMARAAPTAARTATEGTLGERSAALVAQAKRS